MGLIEVKLIPLLGQKTNVPPDDPGLFQWLSDNVALTYDTGGLNFDLDRNKNACSKSYGKTEWPAFESQDITALNEVDVAADRLTLTDATTLTITACDMDEEVYAYWDLTADYLASYVVIDFVLNYSALTMTTSLVGLANSVDDLYGIYSADADCAFCVISSAFMVVYEAASSGHATSFANVSHAASTTYYARMIYTDTTLSFELFSDSTRLTSVGSVSRTLTKATSKKWRYLYAYGGYNDGTSGKDFTGVISDIEIYQAGKSLGLFELYDGTNRNHISFNDGRVYVYNSSRFPEDKSGGTTFANDSIDLYSIIQVGDYVAFADRAEHTPYKWKHGDASVSKLIASGTEYKFRYLMTFQRRVFGLYSDQSDGNIDIRYSTSWPGTAIASMNFPAANQFYVPNDDTITGCGTMGPDRAYVYCEDSIQRIVYYQDYETPFRIYTVVPQQGATNYHSIINLGSRHFFFNKNYGFVEYRGGQELPYGGRPISENIDDVLQDINADYYNMIVGTHVALSGQLVWAVPLTGDSTPSHLLIYNYLTGQWTIEDKAMRFVDDWRMYDSYTWNDFITELGGTGATWEDAGSNTWAYYTALRQRLVMSDSNGLLYYRAGDTDNGAALDGYRIEPVVDFGDKRRKDALQEIWFDIVYSGSFSLDIYWRGGNTVGEVDAASWTTLGTISCSSPASPVLRNFSKSARLHQIKWGTDAASEPFQVNGITLVAQTQSAN